MADDEFNDFFDMSELDESPFDDDVDVGFDDDDILTEEFEDVPGDSEGVSRTFIFIAGAIALAVLAIIILIAMVALSGGDSLTDNQKTATSIAQYNATQLESNNRTVTALAIIDQATATALFNVQQSATAEFIEAQTQQAINAEQTATAVAFQAATMTLEAEIAATQVSLDSTATAVALAARQLVVSLVTEDNVALDNVRVRLYADDGDGQFNPEDRLVSDSSGDAGTEGPSAATSSGTTLAYGQVGDGTLALGETAEWSFVGAAGDVISISAEAVDPTQMDTFLELFGPDGTRLTGDDDGGDGSNALIQEYSLPTNGSYKIEISSIAGQGDYQLRLNVAIEVPGTDPGTDASTDGSTGYRPNTGGEDLGTGIVLARQGGETPTPVPVEPEGDTLITVLEVLNGMVDFGSLEPGDYWLEVEYDSLPASVQAKLPPNQPLYIMVTVPEEGEVGDINFTISYSTPTPTPPVTDTPVPTIPPVIVETVGTPTGSETATPIGDIVTVTPTDEPLPETGFFSDIGDNDIDSTSGLTVLAIVAAGLVAVVVIARKLRTSA